MIVLTVMLGTMAMIPGLPMLPFLILTIATGAVAYALNKHGVLVSLGAEMHPSADARIYTTASTSSPAATGTLVEKI